MNTREERGLVIAATCRIHRKDDGTWLVPSQKHQSEVTAYRVNLEAKTCNCPDHKEGGFTCKHYYAASIVHKRDVLPDGTVIEQKTFEFTEKKVHKQDWPKYNAAQATEKRRLQTLLKELCANLPEANTTHKRGPKPHFIKDAIFAMTFKVYCGLSSRRFTSDLFEAHKNGYVSRAFPGIKVASFFENPYFTPILKSLISYSARPLSVVERSFAIDSSGFGSSRYESYYDHKYGITRNRCVWVKTHIACGVKTNCVTAVRILDKDAADCPQFIPLARETKEGFIIDEMSADKAYSSLDNFNEIAAMGGQAYIAFKSNATGSVGGHFEKAFHYFKLNEEEYMAKYHRRSNVESVFSAVKRKFGHAVMSKMDVSMANEVLCKFLCHNLCCLIMEEESLGIVPVFWKDELTEAADARVTYLPCSSRNLT